jgi:hypothetical protein
MLIMLDKLIMYDIAKAIISSCDNKLAMRFQALLLAKKMVMSSAKVAEDFPV